MYRPRRFRSTQQGGEPVDGVLEDPVGLDAPTVAADLGPRGADPVPAPDSRGGGAVEGALEEDQVVPGDDDRAVLAVLLAPLGGSSAMEHVQFLSPFDGQLASNRGVRGYAWGVTTGAREDANVTRADCPAGISSHGEGKGHLPWR